MPGVATRIYVYLVTVPSGTPEASPVDTDLEFTDGRIERIEIMVPPGPSGLVGFAVIHSSQQIIPYQAGTFIIADNEVLRWDLQRYPEGSPWTIRAYNLDEYDHTLHVRLYINDVPDESPVAQVTTPDDQFIPPGGQAEEEDIGELPPEEFAEDLQEEVAA